jgi:2-dehydropantoate 2-reductase
MCSACWDIAEGYPAREDSFERSRGMLTAAGSPLTASMLRDIERNGPIEADHIVGDLLERGRRHAISGNDSFLKVAYTHLKAYEGRRARTASQT